MEKISPIILALDVPGRKEAMTWVKKLSGKIDVFKIGMQLFYKEGPDIVKEVHDAGGKVFLDLKLHDIPNTVARACESLLPLSPFILNVHAAGGLAMMQAAQAVVEGSNTKLIAVTMLTSLDEKALKDVYPDMTQASSDWVVNLASLTKQAGLYGVVCSGHEDAAIRQKLGTDFCLVNPGVRLASDAKQDQARVMTPQEALAAGGNFVVIGRPILTASDPVAFVEQLNKELACENCLPA